MISIVASLVTLSSFFILNIVESTSNSDQFQENIAKQSEILLSNGSDILLSDVCDILFTNQNLQFIDNIININSHNSNNSSNALQLIEFVLPYLIVCDEFDTIRALLGKNTNEKQFITSNTVVTAPDTKKYIWHTDTPMFWYVTCTEFAFWHGKSEMTKLFLKSYKHFSEMLTVDVPIRCNWFLGQPFISLLLASTHIHIDEPSIDWKDKYQMFQILINELKLPWYIVFSYIHFGLSYKDTKLIEMILIDAYKSNQLQWITSSMNFNDTLTFLETDDIANIPVSTKIKYTNFFADIWFTMVDASLGNPNSTSNKNLDKLVNQIGEDLDIADDILGGGMCTIRAYIPEIKT